MADKDEMLWPLPTRTGVATGASNERQMLDSSVDRGGFSTRIRVNPDGSKTMLRTKGGMAQFSTLPAANQATEIPTDTACRLVMDSGMLDIVGFGDGDPGQLANARIFPTDYVELQTATSFEGKAIGCGEIDSDTYSGEIVSSGTDAAGYKSDSGGYMSYVERKRIALKVPSSLFTGRMRLYVQSLYGGNWKDLAMEQLGAGRPQLSINTAQRIDSELVAVTIGSGCGIYLDPLNKTHWLIIPTETQVFVMPLVATTCAEKFRSSLLSDSLSDQNKERIESYILAHSMPIPELASILDIPSTPSEALGYSWHFNWDGTACDIIDVEEILVPGTSVYGFKTTHYRLVFSVVDFNFSVDRQVIAGPDTWSVAKHGNPIAYPEWTSGNLLKAGNMPSGQRITAQSGRLYCFYNKNDLQVVTYNGTPSSHDPIRESTPTYFGGEDYSSQFKYIVEGEGGTTLATDAWTGFSDTFTVGGVTVGGESGNRTQASTAATWTGRELTSGYIWDQPNTGTSGVTHNIDTGTPSVSFVQDINGAILSASPTYSTVSVVTPYTITNAAARSRWLLDIKSSEKIKSYHTLIVIPFSDAEAVYVSGYNQETELGSHNTISMYFDDGPYTNADCYILGSHYEKWLLAGEDGWQYDSSSPSEPVDATTTNQQSSKLVCSQGTFEFSPLFESAFYNTTDTIPQNYGTQSSVNGVVLSSVNNVMVGSTIYPIYSSLVGWA